MFPRLKNVLKNLNVTSQCCIAADDHDDDDEWRLFLIQRIKELEAEYLKCKEHQLKLRAEIATLSAHLDRIVSSSGPSTIPHQEDT